ncbi:response regulator transcription factor [Arthrobacter sp. H35-D1]|uniref:response regulator transcription factor n=1 Tax=Arthrobacter sp. H35-D1 TaxID=3046202 RepID=UPI0024BA470B|nr:response regulator transcription factor [Arthrobacter sp. H35-D1]MDJ0313138.1 response regulator transcription factor [Arthrobacter sp. H35-D1]
MNRILIVEDEERIATFVQKGLNSKGFVTKVVGDGQSAYHEASSRLHDLLILDIGLPDMDGLTVLHRLREERVSIPVIILSARSSVSDKVAGLVGGADDYLPKPFAFEELLARVRLRLRGHVLEDQSGLKAGGLILDLRTRRALVDGVAKDLSAREFALAETLCRHRDQVLSREQLLSQVWGFDFDPGSNVVDVYIRYLRKKLGAERIETVRGMGYRMRTD